MLRRTVPFIGDPPKMSALRCNVLATDSDDDLNAWWGNCRAHTENDAVVRRRLYHHPWGASALARRSVSRFRGRAS
jgi:hypothetical protein